MCDNNFEVSTWSCNKELIFDSADDEPIFVIRAKDNKSIEVLKSIRHFYGHIDRELVRVVTIFEYWRHNNPDKCEEPD